MQVQLGEAVDLPVALGQVTEKFRGLEGAAVLMFSRLQHFPKKG